MRLVKYIYKAVIIGNRIILNQKNYVEVMKKREIQTLANILGCNKAGPN